MCQAELVERVERADATRIAAIPSKDRAVLRRVLADEMLHVHANGFRGGPRRVYRPSRRGTLRLSGDERRSPQVLVGEHVVLVDGTMHIEFAFLGAINRVRTRYLQVWFPADDDRRLVRFHAAPLAT